VDHFFHFHRGHPIEVSYQCQKYKKWSDSEILATLSPDLRKRSSPLLTSLAPFKKRRNTFPQGYIVAASQQH